MQQHYQGVEFEWKNSSYLLIHVIQFIYISQIVLKYLKSTNIFTNVIIFFPMFQFPRSERQFNVLYHRYVNDNIQLYIKDKPKIPNIIYEINLHKSNLKNYAKVTILFAET